MRSRARWNAVLAAMLVAALVPAAGAGAHDGDGVEAAQSEEHEVLAVEEEFIPPVVTIGQGDTVTWRAPAENLDRHTMHEDDNHLFEEELQPGTSFSYRFTRVGTINYHCDIHPGMEGQVVVQPLEDPFPPEAPQNVTATAGEGSATITWVAPEFDGGSPVTDYVVTTEPGGDREIFGSSPATITGLTSGESYTFEVRAINAAGEGAPATSNAVTPTEVTDPDPSPSPSPSPDPDAGVCGEDVAPAVFTDRDAIPETHRGNVDCAASLAVISGFADDTYRPTVAVRRDQMASFIARSLDAAGVVLPAHTGERFTDVAAGSTHDDAIHRLAAAGIVQGGAGGLPATAYGGDQGVRRDQMASFLLRATSFAAQADLASQTQAFPDVGSANPHFANVNGAAQVGLATGFADGTYGPGAGVRRDQMATFVVRLLDHLHGEAE